MGRGHGREPAPLVQQLRRRPTRLGGMTMSGELGGTNDDDTTAEETWDKEAIYDEKIAPLMTQIIAICNEHHIPMLATFQYKLDGGGDGGLCTTALLSEEWGTAKQLVAALNLIRTGFAAFTARVVSK